MNILEIEIVPPEKLYEEDLEEILGLLPATVINLLKVGGILAGGFIRSTLVDDDGGLDPVSDIDIFFPEGAGLPKLEGKMTITNNAQTYSHQGHIIQLINTFPCQSAAQLIANFDFTVNQAAIYFLPLENRFESVVSERFYEDLGTRKLVTDCISSNPERSLLRAFKFTKRGYDLDYASLARLIKAVAQDHLFEEESLAKRLAGPRPLGEKIARAVGY